MTQRAGERYTYPPSSPTGKKRRRRRNDRFLMFVTTCLTAAALLAAGGVICWKGCQFIWNGIHNVLEFLSPGPPTVAVIESTAGDREAPVLAGIHDFTLYQGDTVSYMSGITAADDVDASPSVRVDSSGVDLTRPGVYTVVYTATDASGNTSRETASVTVMEKREGYVELDTIYTAADSKLREIIRDNATVQQQVQDIYAWARQNISYGGHSDRTDWLQTAYTMLTDGRGDCYGYWAVTKLLFERLGIPNIDVKKVRNHEEDSDHFWSLVSLDGGESWYHFDATPRQGDGDDFCLVTDAFLDAYSDAHKGSHNRDKQLYPKTPQEADIWKRKS